MSSAPADTVELEARLLLEALHRRYGQDFRGYAPVTMARRLERARQHFGCRSLSALQDRALHEPAILPALIDILTIRVSDMFRDPAYFRALREEVLPLLATWPSLKVWVAGCGEGEELYALAILFREEGLAPRTMFYATDISPAALRKAKIGIYPRERLAAFSANYQRSGGRSSLSDYYTAAYGAAVFDRSLREQVLFSDHSLASDQVFSEIHLVSCRNVLIYFEQALKERAIGLFKDALVPSGFLGLGASETLAFSPLAEAFVEHVPRQRIYRKAYGR